MQHRGEQQNHEHRQPERRRGDAGDGEHADDLVGPSIPIQGRDHAEDHCDDHADDEAEERQLQRDGQSFADAIGHRGVVRAVGAEVALYEADDEVTVLHEDGIVQSVLLAILLGLGFSGVLAKDRIRLVDRRECHDEEDEDGDTEDHDRQRYEASSD